MSATPAPAPAERPQRADARRNRDKVVAAARDAFAEDGLDAQMDAIARRAGVGVGTVYRHFPTKDALVEAMVVLKFETLAVEARRVLAEEDGDPWEALRDLLFFGGETHAADRGLSQVRATLPNHRFEAAARETGLQEAMAELIARAKAAGVVRPDVTVHDIPMVMCAVGAVVEAHEQGMPGSWRRILTLVLDGMRVSTAPPLPR